MSLITIIDAETTGTDPNKDGVIEVAAILYSLDYAAVVHSASALLYCRENPAEPINGIRVPELALSLPSDYDMLAVVDRIAIMMKTGIAVVAHNAEFDRSFIARCEGDPGFSVPWVCSMKHIDWPKQAPDRKLTSIALAHGVPILSAHRAMSDCDTLARLFTRVHEMGTDLNELMRLAMRPRVIVRALVSYDDRQLAKDAGFDWNGDTKQWTKEVVKEVWQKTGYGFSTQVVGDAK